MNKLVRRIGAALLLAVALLSLAAPFASRPVGAQQPPPSCWDAEGSGVYCIGFFISCSYGGENHYGHGTLWAGPTMEGVLEMLSLIYNYPHAFVGQPDCDVANINFQIYGP